MVPQNIIKELIEKYNEGQSMNKLSKIYSIHEKTIGKIFKRNNIKTRNLIKNPKLNTGIKEDLLNQRFSRLLVIEPAESINGKSSWKCLCDCGNIKIVKAKYLKNGDTKSCGCLNIEKRKERYKSVYQIRQKYFDPQTAAAAKILRDRYSDTDLTLEQFIAVTSQPCYYCGRYPKTTNSCIHKNSSQDVAENGYFTYNGLDRIDSSKDHSKNNVVTCCKYCNYAKHNMSVQEFTNHIKRYYEKNYAEKD